MLVIQTKLSARIKLVARRHGLHPADLELLQRRFQPPQVLADNPDFVSVRAQTKRGVIRTVLAFHKCDTAVRDQAGFPVSQLHSQSLGVGVPFPTGGSPSALVLSVPVSLYPDSLCLLDCPCSQLGEAIEPALPKPFGIRRIAQAQRP